MATIIPGIIKSVNPAAIIIKDKKATQINEPSFLNDKKNILLKLNDSLAAAVINKAIVIKIWKRIKKTDKTNNKKAGLIVAIVNDDKRLAKKLIQKLIAIKEAMLFIAPTKASKTNCQNFFSNKRQVSRNSFQEALIIECFCKNENVFLLLIVFCIMRFLYYAFIVAKSQLTVKNTVKNT